MESVLKQYIRKVLFEEFVREALPDKKGHYKWQFDQRITKAIPEKSNYRSPYNKTIPSKAISKLWEIVEYIKKIDFPLEPGYAVKLIDLHNSYKHLDLNLQGDTQIDKNTGRIKESRGDTIWVLIRENEIKTIFLRYSSQPNNIADIQYYLESPLTFEYYYDEMPKKENGRVDFKLEDFRRIEKAQRSIKKETLPKVELRGQTWYVDDDKKRLVQKTKLGKEIATIEDFENNLTDDELLAVWDVLEKQVVEEIYFM